MELKCVLNLGSHFEQTNNEPSWQRFCGLVKLEWLGFRRAVGGSDARGRDGRVASKIHRLGKEPVFQFSFSWNVFLP